MHPPLAAIRQYVFVATKCVFLLPTIHCLIASAAADKAAVTNQ